MTVLKLRKLVKKQIKEGMNGGNVNYQADYGKDEEDTSSASWAINTLINGNISDFKEWAKTATKSEVLDAVLYYITVPPYNRSVVSAKAAIEHIKKYVE